MNKGIKIFSIILLITLIIFQYSVISNAANDEGATQSEAEETAVEKTATDEESSQTEIILKTDSNKIKKGEEIKVYIYLNNAKLEDGINGCEGSISYDKEVLEPITQNDISYNGWNATWNTENGMIIIQRNNITAEKQEMAELIFKVKKDTTAESTDIKFSNIVVSDGFEEDDEIEEATLKLTITEAENSGDGENKDDNNGSNNDSNKEEQEKPSNGNSDGNNDNNGDSNNNDGDKKEEEQQKPAVDNNNNSNGSSSNNKDSGTSEKAESVAATNNKTNNESLPKTGMNQWMIGATGIILLLGIVSYIKYKKYKNI